MEVGNRVSFIGPKYQFTFGPTPGKEGVVVAMDGHHSQRVGRDKEELVAVRFDGEGKDSNIGKSRLVVM